VKRCRCQIQIWTLCKTQFRNASSSTTIEIIHSNYVAALATSEIHTITSPNYAAAIATSEIHTIISPNAKCIVLLLVRGFSAEDRTLDLPTQQTQTYLTKRSLTFSIRVTEFHRRMPEINRTINKYLSIDRHTNKILINIMLLRQTNYVLSVVPKNIQNNTICCEIWCSQGSVHIWGFASSGVITLC
jgi:hypothetical protein